MAKESKAAKQPTKKTAKNENGKPQPPQRQSPPGDQDAMLPEPETISPNYKPAGKLAGKTALITGGDSGIGRSVAVHFAKEGADIAIIYLNEHDDAEKTKKIITKEGRNCLLIDGDIGDYQFCEKAVRMVQKEMGHIHILVNNAAEQHPHEGIEDLDLNIMEKTFRTNIFAMFYLAKLIVPSMRKGDCVINTTSVTAYRANPNLLDYSSTKGAITAFTRSLGKNLAEKGIRVNGVAPGPIWTPLIPSTFGPDDVASFGKDTPMKRVGQPSEVAPAFVYLASSDSTYVTGQVIHVNGGDIVNA
ncbi:MAG: SDR family oxidoreductase [Chitinophagales bacterium]|nr:SDR family oxidoreductase [Chitinophagales bacterium]